MRKVVASSEVYHLWANQTQTEARNAGDTVSFHGNQAYSYAAVIGQIVTNVRGEKAYVRATGRYSNTTARHQRLLSGAIPSYATVFDVPDEYNLNGLSDTVALNVMLEKANELYQKSRRARTNKPWLAREAAEMLQNAINFAEFFDLALPETLNGNDLSTVSGAIETLAAQQKAEADRRRAEYAAQQEAYAQEALGNWLAGGDYDYKLTRLAYPRMRIKDGSVETTLGAVVPLSAVKRVTPVILAGVEAREKGEEPVYPVHRSIGPYPLKDIEKDGTVVVGCHRFPAAEIRRFSKEIEVPAA